MYDKDIRDRAKKCPIEKLLEAAGKDHIVLRRSTEGGKYFLSPFREEKNASLYVFPNNEWWDMGDPTKKYSGDAINMAEYLWGLNYTQSIKKISEIMNNGGIVVSHRCANLVEKNGLTEHRLDEEKGTTVLAHHPIQDKALMTYVMGRGIHKKTCDRYVEEVHYEVNARKYIGIGLRTDNGGYAIRGIPNEKHPEGIKRNIGPTDISIHYAVGKSFGTDCLIVEGMMDMMSYDELYGPHSLDVICLNSVSNLSKLKNLAIRGPKVLHCFTDNDKAGSDAIGWLKENSGCRVIDARGNFAPYKDLNDYLMSKELTGIL